MKRTTLSVAVATLAMVLSTTVALAVDAVVTRDTDVYRRSSGNAVVNEVDRNQVVDVVECERSRCRVRIPGPDGWVRQDRLARLDSYYDDDDDDRGRGRGRDRDRDRGRDRDRDSGFSLEFNIGPGGPGVSVGDGRDADSGSRVCIYQHDNYGGASRCFARGTRVNNLTSLGWNDSMSSVRVFRGARARICEHAGGGGVCQDFRSDAPSVPGFNDLASYIEVN
jgi:hypothetical protein